MRVLLRVRPALTLALLTFLSGCSKTETRARTEPARSAAPQARVAQPTRAKVSAASAPAAIVPAAWPEANTLNAIRADQLLTRIRESGKKGALVNAWASWCGPCREELPMLASLARNLATQSIDVVLISVDEPEDRAEAEAFLKSFEIRLPAYAAARPLGDFKVGLNPRWPGMLPASFLFDANGKLRYFWGGEAFENEIVTVIDGFLAGKPIDGESDFALAPGQTNAH